MNPNEAPWYVSLIVSLLPLVLFCWAVCGTGGKLRKALPRLMDGLLRKCLRTSLES